MDRIELLQEEITRAKLNLMRRPNTLFISTVCASLKHIVGDRMPNTNEFIGTAATNGKVIVYNPDFLEKQDKDTIMGLMCHEALHIILRHCGAMGVARFGNYNRKILNVAMDHVINIMAIDMGLKIPDNGHCNFDYRGMATEEIYAILIKSQINPDLYELDVYPPGDNPDSEEDSRHADGAIADMLARAVTLADMSGQSGSVPGDVRVYLQNLYDPSIPWDVLLPRWFTSKVKSGYNYAKRNMRYAHVCKGIFMPKRESKGLNHAAFAMDLSGSVGDVEIDHFASDVIRVITTVPVQKLTLVQFDEEISSVTEVRTQHDVQNTAFIGRGGTDIEPVILWANENKPDVMIIFTDGEFRDCLIQPLVDVLYVVHNNPGFQPTYGEVIHYKLKL